MASPEKRRPIRNLGDLTSNYSFLATVHSKDELEEFRCSYQMTPRKFHTDEQKCVYRCLKCEFRIVAMRDDDDQQRFHIYANGQHNPFKHQVTPIRNARRVRPIRKSQADQQQHHGDIGDQNFQMHGVVWTFSGMVDTEEEVQQLRCAAQSEPKTMETENFLQFRCRLRLREEKCQFKMLAIRQDGDGRFKIYTRGEHNHEVVPIVPKSARKKQKKIKEDVRPAREKTNFKSAEFVRSSSSESLASSSSSSSLDLQLRDSPNRKRKQPRRQPFEASKQIIEQSISPESMRAPIEANSQRSTDDTSAIPITSPVEKSSEKASVTDKPPASTPSPTKRKRPKDSDKVEDFSPDAIRHEWKGLELEKLSMEKRIEIKNFLIRLKAQLTASKATSKRSRKNPTPKSLSPVKLSLSAFSSPSTPTRPLTSIKRSDSKTPTPTKPPAAIGGLNMLQRSYQQTLPILSATSTMGQFTTKASTHLSETCLTQIHQNIEPTEQALSDSTPGQQSLTHNGFPAVSPAYVPNFLICPSCGFGSVPGAQSANTNNNNGNWEVCAQCNQQLRAFHLQAGVWN